jgi:gluconate 2-dehydrogenase gamma chain
MTSSPATSDPSPSDPKRTLDRRALLLGVAVLLGGAAALTRFTRQPEAASSPGGPALSAEQFSLLEAIVDVMIPATDTPGALAADVPAFIRGMLEEWASPATRAEITGVLGALEGRAWSKYGAGFVELQPERRFELMRAFDADHVGSQDVPYSKFKYLVLVGYYHSEIGATQELRYELVPGAWRGCVPLSEIGRASPV